MADRCVKGTLMADYARMIKANPELDWKKYLKPEDWKVIEGKILESVWYPFDTFSRCGVAIFKIIAQGNLELVKLWGKSRADYLFTQIYRSLGESPNPIIALKKYIGLRKTFTNFDMFEMELEEISANHIKIKTKSVEQKNEGNEPFTWQIAGSIEKLIELTGGKKPKFKILAKEWKGDPHTISEWTWE
ncbi:MAG: hypothetical protein NTX00_02110 [Candidatus Parcubacteria bacterium]|nr:hypothetical protein [Candidatus Parcubacteria bacterium]